MKYRSLERDKHSEAERIQALKLVRAIMEAECSLMPAPIIQALIACAENQEDSFCRVCLETLCEIGMRGKRRGGRGYHPSLYRVKLGYRQDRGERDETE